MRNKFVNHCLWFSINYICLATKFIQYIHMLLTSVNTSITVYVYWQTDRQMSLQIIMCDNHVCHTVLEVARQCIYNNFYPICNKQVRKCQHLLYSVVICESAPIVCGKYIFTSSLCPIPLQISMNSLRKKIYPHASNASNTNSNYVWLPRLSHKYIPCSPL